MATGRIPTTANSPLTAKGDLFTFSTGSAKLAVGNNGETLVADSSTSTGLAYREDYAAGKNKIINGDFRINQRNFTSVNTDSAYCFDRWVIRTPDTTLTVTPQTFTPGTAPVVGYEGTNFVQLVTSGSTGATAQASIEQRIEDVRTFANQTVTLSFWAKTTSGTPKIAIEFRQSFGSGGSATVNSYAGQVTLSTSWTRYSVTYAIPSISGKTIGTSSSITSVFWVSAGTSYDSRTGSLGIQNGTFQIWGVQVEDGSVATAFQTATGTLQGELAACQRYYVRWGDGTQTYPSVANSGFTVNTTTAAGFMTLPVRMRTLPSSADFSTLTIQDINLNNFTVSAVSLDTATFSGLSVAVNFTSTGMTAARFLRVTGNNSTSSYFALSAEL